MQLTKEQEKRFLSRFKQGEKESCWIWEGNKTGNGYGSLAINGKQIPTHRLSYEYFVGPIPEGMCVCHTCDTPLCLNFNHLWLGTKKDNMRDCVNKDRNYHSRGEKHPKHKLTEEQVKEIRASTLKRCELGQMYGVAKSTIKDIKNGKNWSWLK
jgi:uncharacterized protein (UPF0248 family)